MTNSCTGVSSERVDGFSSNLHRYIIVTRLRANLILVTLTLFLSS